MLPITKPFLPPEQEYKTLLDGIWNRNWLTNDGPLVTELELELKNFLELDHILYVSNGTIALQIALKALNINKEVITTPFSYVATTSSIVWEGCKPVYVDIDSQTLNIDANKIENAITPDTQAILATHCFGNPCDVETIDKIAKKHNLKVIYDAAHCFGTKYKEKSIFKWGDISTTSFHATKLFHTVEGGAIFTKDAELLKKMAFMRNFGHNGPGRFEGVGINGKNSEFHAAMGIANLKYVCDILEQRKILCERYNRLLKGLDVQKQLIRSYSRINHAYYPLIFKKEKVALRMKAELEKQEIFPRRYFYPSLSRLSYINTNETPITDNISRRILCLPLFHLLTEEEQELISGVLLRTQNS